MLGKNELPFAVVGERCLIKVHQPKTHSAGGIEIPATAQNRPFTGTLIDAGLIARDKLHSHGIHIGDDILFGKFAGVVEEWDHVIEGDAPGSLLSDEWTRLPSKPGQAEKWRNDRTGAVRAAEPVVVLNCDDILASVNLAGRLRGGLVEVVHGETATGKPQHALMPTIAVARGEAAHRRALSVVIGDDTTTTLANGAS